MNPRNCEPCSAEPNQYEDDWLCSLISWLDAVTCIQWIRAYPDSAAPDIEDTRTGQYGTVNVDNIDYRIPQRISNAASTENEVCVRMSHRVEAVIELRVYNHAQMPLNNGQRLKTSGDVLMRVLDAYHGIPRLSDALKRDGLSIESFGQINNSAEYQQSHYQRQSSIQITFCINRSTSFADDLIAGFTLDASCDNNHCE